MATRDKGPEPSVSDPDAPPSEEELAESARLREALEDPSKPHEGADFARALALAHEPRPLDPDAHRDIVSRAVVGTRRRGRVIRVAFGAATALALAAGVALLIKGKVPLPFGAAPVGSSPSLAVARSTQPLFREPFAPVGGESARIDRILLARAGDLRENEFTRWGVR
jgi:hypothetical protein